MLRHDKIRSAECGLFEVPAANMTSPPPPPPHPHTSRRNEPLHPYTFIPSPRDDEFKPLDVPTPEKPGYQITE